MNAMDEVVLVNAKNEPLGTLEKMAAHLEPTLHRAFSVFLFDSRNKLLLQQRAHHKYHSGGLWTNTCCSHPRPAEQSLLAARRRLREELGVDASIYWAFDFIYEASFDNGLYEHEYDQVFIGVYNGVVKPNSAEVSSYSYKSIDEIKADVIRNPHNYTVWFKIALPKVEAYLASNPLATE